MMQITIHEAMPGHYVQFEIANNLEPKSRRALRNIYGNVPYVEGWALYTQQMMSEQGFMDNSAELQMTFYKQLLRSIANAILDIRLQTMGMTDQQALDLMMKDAFQQEGEAVAKWKRARLTSAQLSTYFVGVTEHLDLRDKARAKAGGSFDLRKYNDQVISYGSPPVKYVRELMGL